MSTVTNSNSTNATQLHMSLSRDTLHASFDSTNTPLDHSVQTTHCALWLQSGSIKIDATPLTIGHGLDLSASSIVTCHGVEPAVILRFILSSEPLATLSKTTSSTGTAVSEILYTQPINTTSTQMLLRLDQVDFPPAAIAYKHTHPGPGIRYLVDGGLTLVSDHGEQVIETGDAWFEDANSAVKASAISTQASCFVRTMLLPIEFEGRSTFTLVSPTDAGKPRLQTNIRHYEKRIMFSDT